jgi:hypothetical protein
LRFDRAHLTGFGDQALKQESPAPGVSIACPARQVSLVSAPVSPA